MANKKVAIIYDRINKWGGAERVLIALSDLFPKATLITSVYNTKNTSWVNVFSDIKTSFLHKIPFLRNRHEYIPYFMPIAFESVCLKEYDLIISVTSEAAKGIITLPHQKHICYLLTPTRYLWSGYEEYFENKYFKATTKPLVKYLRRWDIIASRRPDKIITISTEVKTRIKKYYGLDASIVYPPVTAFPSTATDKKPKEKDYYLIVGRLVSYKRIDLAVKAFNKLNKKLVIIGIGKEEKKLKKLANKNIIFKGFLKDEDVSTYYKYAKAFIMPQLEDFGITAIEAQSFGTPVIAYKRGGAWDTVIDGKTGVLFEDQTVDGVVDAVKRFDKMKFNRKNIINNSKRFSLASFKNKIKKELK